VGHRDELVVRHLAVRLHLDVGGLCGVRHWGSKQSRSVIGKWGEGRIWARADQLDLPPQCPVTLGLEHSAQLVQTTRFPHPHPSTTSAQTYLVACRVTVVGAAEGGDAQTVVLNRIAVLADLMRANDGRNLVELAPSASDVGTKAEADTLLC
jgi:hypothetical protein